MYPVMDYKNVNKGFATQLYRVYNFSYFRDPYKRLLKIPLYSVNTRKRENKLSFLLFEIYL